MRNIKSKGFTLIELLVVIAIIGMISSVVLGALSSARIKGYDAKYKVEMKSLLNAIALYFDKTGSLPSGSQVAPLGQETWTPVSVSDNTQTNFFDKVLDPLVSSKFIPNIPHYYDYNTTITAPPVATSVNTQNYFFNDYVGTTDATMRYVAICGNYGNTANRANAVSIIKAIQASGVKGAIVVENQNSPKKYYSTNTSYTRCYYDGLISGGGTFGRCDYYDQTTLPGSSCFPL